MLIVCDPQIDLCDDPEYRSSIPLEGATVALNRIASLIDRVGYHGMNPLTTIAIVRESNSTIDITHPAFWKNAMGQHPYPYTVITYSDIMEGRWMPIKDFVMTELKNMSIKNHCLAYTMKLQKKGLYPLMVYPPYCLEGTINHAVHPILDSSLKHWEEDQFASITFIDKTRNAFVDQVGAIEANFKLKSDTSTGTDLEFLNTIAKCGTIGICGLMASHTIRRTVEQIMFLLKKTTRDIASRIYIIEDCCVPMGEIHGQNFPQIWKDWLERAKSKGVNVVKADDFL